jgi:hypothetical protein
MLPVPGAVWRPNQPESHLPGLVLHKVSQEQLQPITGTGADSYRRRGLIFATNLSLNLGLI